MSLLLQVIAGRTAVAAFGPRQWDQLMREVRGQRLESRISYLLEDRGLHGGCPLEAWEELCAQRYQPRFVQAQMRLELRKLAKATATTTAGSPMLLLKGAAYMLAGLPLARGRTFTDLDILVPRERLEEVEASLLAAGWVHHNTDDYDQRYYRRWMHELPPMYHQDRGVLVDVHHSILPLTSRLTPDIESFWAESVPLPMPSFRALCPADMLLHSAAHLFQDGEISGQLPGLLDLHELIGSFAEQTGFWDRLLAHAERHQLGRPLYYALHFTSTLLGTQVPAGALESARRFAPGPVNDRLMKLLVPRVLEPRYPTRRPAAFSAWLLYLRSHWLRMPPVLLASHLTRKALRRPSPSYQGN